MATENAEGSGAKKWTQSSHIADCFEIPYLLNQLVRTIRSQGRGQQFARLRFNVLSRHRVFDCAFADARLLQDRPVSASQFEIRFSCTLLGSQLRVFEQSNSLLHF